MQTWNKSICRAVLLLAAILFGGCVGTRRTTAVPPRTITDFKIVEQSFPRELTAAEQAQIQMAVENFLNGADIDRSGVDEVRVTFKPAQPGQPGEWVVVRVSRLVVQSYARTGRGPTGPYRGYDYYNDRFGYGPWGSDFSDPLYPGYGYTYPSVRGGDRRPPRDDSRDRDKQPPPPRTDDPTSTPHRPMPPEVLPDRPRFEPRTRSLPDRNRDEDRRPPEPSFRGRGRPEAPEPAPRVEPPPAPPPQPPPPPPAPERSVPDAPRETGRGNLRSRVE